MVDIKTDNMVSPIVSICIPTYNRAEKTFELIRNLLRYEGDDVEVVVLDNVSTDHTSSLLGTIADKRFSYIINEVNIGGPLNHLKALTVGKGMYAVLCLDKDRLDSTKIPLLVEKLKINKEVVFGHFKLNLTTTSSDIVYDKGFDSLFNMCYLSAHPSGMFYKTAIFKQLPKLALIFSLGEKFGFYPDIMNGEMAMYGKSLVINSPIFYTESKDEAAHTLSFTYNVDDIFFSPTQRMLEFNRYVDCIVNLEINKVEVFKIIKHIYMNCLLASTIGYKNILNDKDICKHYGISTKIVNHKEIIRINFLFSSSFLRKRLPLSYLSKLCITVGGHVRVFLAILRT